MLTEWTAKADVNGLGVEAGGGGAARRGTLAEEPAGWVEGRVGVADSPLSGGASRTLTGSGEIVICGIAHKKCEVFRAWYSAHGCK